MSLRKPKLNINSSRHLYHFFKIKKVETSNKTKKFFKNKTLFPVENQDYDMRLFIADGDWLCLQMFRLMVTFF